MFACSIDYPVEWFVVVVGQGAVAGKNAIAYEVKHLLQYPQDKVGELQAQVVHKQQFAQQLVL